MKDRNYEFESLVEFILKEINSIHELLQQVEWENPDSYGQWLAQTYYYVLQATRLLSYAASRCSFEQEEMHRSLLKGAAEEMGHELLALNDMKALSLDIESFSELPETAAYHQTLYYAIDHDGPIALLGYFLPLEGVASLRMRPIYEKLCQSYTRKAASFLQVHCELDVNHFEEGINELESLTAEQREVVRRNVSISVQLYKSIVLRIIQANKVSSLAA
ncbi:MAG: iron-containing redox enzyme family protein [Bdellovibrionota bacterium]